MLKYKREDTSKHLALCRYHAHCRSFLVTSTGLKKLQRQVATVDPGFNQRHGNAIDVSYDRTDLYAGFERNEIASRDQDTQ